MTSEDTYKRTLELLTSCMSYSTAQGIWLAFPKDIGLIRDDAARDLIVSLLDQQNEKARRSWNEHQRRGNI